MEFLWSVHYLIHLVSFIFRWIFLYFPLMIKVLLLSLRSHSNKTKCCFAFWYLFCVNNVLRPRHKILSFSACSYCFMLFMLLFWLDWPQLMLAASWCAVLIVSRPFSPTLPQSSPFMSSILLLSVPLPVFDFLHTACHCQSPSFGHLLISHPLSQ